MSNDIEIAASFKDIWDPKRYKVYYGGRGGAKSHNIARFLLVKGAEKKTRILCTRELQSSIADSVHKLLVDIISDNKALLDFYEIQRDRIIGKNGTEFIFKGLKHKRY